MRKASLCGRAQVLRRPFSDERKPSVTRWLRLSHTMLDFKLELADALCGVLDGLFPGHGLHRADILDMFEYPPDSSMGDIAFPCFKLSKTLRRAPAVIAAELQKGLSDMPYLAASEVKGGYLNLFIAESYYTEHVLEKIMAEGERYGSSDMGRGKTVVLDYSSPNVAKPFHIGHLGTTVIGHSLKKLHEFAGYHCVGINHLGDWGTQFGKLIAAYRLWGSREEIEKGGVDALVALYVRVNNAIKAEEDASVSESGTGEKHSALADAARNEFHKLETGDPENLALWKWFKEISLAEYEKTYKMLGITFDSYNGEAFYTDKMPRQVEILREKNLLKLDDGASIVDLSEYHMPPCLILKRDGSTLYPTRDIAAAAYRAETYHFDKCIYVTSSAQSLHFAQWFKVVELMGYDWYDKLVHVPYGTVSINGEKLATRTGNVILLRDLFAAAIDKVCDIMREKNPDVDLAGMRDTAEAVGVGAIVFHYLSNSRIKDMNFVMEDALNFDGNTGPYAQYTYARCCSLLEKAEPDAMLSHADYKPCEAELALLKVLSRYGERVLDAIAAYEPMLITRFILDVCAAFNRFYHECRIASASEPEARKFRLQLTAATRSVLGSAFGLICMKKTEKI